MQLTQEEIIKLSEIKRKIKKELKKEEYYKKLYSRKQEILNYLKTTNYIKKDNDLLDKYERIGEQLKKIELQTAFKIAENNENKKSKNKLIEKIFRIKHKEKVKDYTEEFNKITEDIDYKNKIKKHKDIFKRLGKTSKKYQELLYELESVETEIATIETERLMLYIRTEYN